MTGIGMLAKNLIEKEVGRLWTATVAKVVSVDYEKNLCSVTIKNTVGGNEVTLRDLPVMYPSTSAGTLMLAISEGDLVLVIFGKWNIREQIAGDGIDTVNEETIFSINNGIVIPGIFSQSEGVPYILQEKDIVLRHSSGAGIKLSGDGEIKIVAKKLDICDMSEGYKL
ncbi:Gp138 family membrane-puncturing spike protein [Methanolacinia petrolearia]|uniref:Gp138 family membrane-puncturing spike protein n=1 Tax=Methanolacinia petrolearia TaxID=54120 RepID=UPI003BA943A4